MAMAGPSDPLVYKLVREALKIRTFLALSINLRSEQHDAYKVKIASGFIVLNYVIFSADPSHGLKIALDWQNRTLNIRFWAVNAYRATVPRSPDRRADRRGCGVPQPPATRENS